MQILWIYWNPHRSIFTIPYIDHPIGWYGLFFVTGLIIGYFILNHLLQRLFSQTKMLYPRDFIHFNHFPKQIEGHLTEIKIKSSDPNRLLEQLNQAKITKQQLQLLPSKILYSSAELALYLTDKMLWFIVLGILIGARLGHVFFYDWSYYHAHPEKIIKIWEGGLASHGGTIGVMVGLILYKKLILKNFPELSLLRLFDYVVIPTALVAFFIRLGNFFNQEITGVTSSAPWAIVFGNPAEGMPNTPRHPVQLYEAFSYLAIFFLLYFLWKHKETVIKTGVITGIFFILVFTSRFIIEFWKMPQNGVFDDIVFQTGQLLSLPFILLGTLLIGYALKPKIFQTQLAPKS